jgi:hypothetical protein
MYRDAAGSMGGHAGPPLRGRETMTGVEAGPYGKAEGSAFPYYYRGMGRSKGRRAGRSLWPCNAPPAPI